MPSLVDMTRTIVRRFGFTDPQPPGRPPLPGDFDSQAAATIERVRGYTLTSPERLFALIQAVRYVAAAGVRGDIVECGVWRGGSMMAAARTLLECGDTERHLYLFDTFQGMSAPGDLDVDMAGRPAGAMLGEQDRRDADSIWCYAALDDVRSAMATTGYGDNRMHFVEGKVEDTVPRLAPQEIAVLRLDTDWYESTRHELEHLYPRLVAGGVLIIDDYGHWAGCRRAVDEYFASRGISLLLHRIDYTGRSAVKRGSGVRS